ncbi:insulinase family protein [Bacteroidales bacterium OttesenSCG-928-B11]|nr:insulinase family protein [Bacteroidales bacterium OttesenSCG-928-E04]MDL2309112.1 insulinase family protein [Bacteroidales bacterium OttesenSCG-928-C03]MDL2312945.1 insulinase family protein [Bacteroidales bacterium OttesenSCG-928-B11]MDL2326675.1 insulinase family protein [Bacteroidales bacterium OttesenSCG-928-A14]
MRKLSVILLLLLPFTLFSQPGQLSVKTFQLANGMTVMVCEDHSAPEIYGGVIVHVGSKNDPPDATGMAHYFEHIMFKGTDRIGTVDWELEKPYLDSISMMYDKLHETTNETERKNIQLEINRLSIASAQYAIPNEMDQILSKMGGKGINAYTNFDATVYYNRFPSNQLKKWMDVYYERFRNPVFRLFQNELETVYEEKNMYADNPFERAFADLMKEVFDDHPYSHPILGYTEHLKNPQISKMQQFFDTYYVPNNMTLVLTGDLRIDEVQQLAESTFGQLQHKELPAQSFPEIKPFSGRNEITKHLTPVKAGALGYFTCTANHEDYYKLQLLSALFNNDAESGLMDQLNNNSDLYMSFVLDYSMRDVGLMGFVYVPKILSQSLNNAEKLIMNCIDSVKKGDFSDQLFEAVKMEFLIDMVKGLESQSRKFNLISTFAENGSDWQNYNRALEELNSITKQDIISLANKYLGDDYIAYKTKMGFPKKDKIEKPNWKPVVAINNDSKSVFAERMEKEKSTPIVPQVIDFNNDVSIISCTEHYPLYASKNPYNNIFTVEFNFYCGRLHNPEIVKAVEYFNKVGTATKSFQQFLLDLQQLGGRLQVRAAQNQLIVKIEGFEDHIDQILSLCAEKFRDPEVNDKVIRNIVSDQRMSYRMYRHSPSNWAYPLFEYMIYGENSAYLTRPGVKDVKQFTAQHLIQQIKDATSTSGYIIYVGNHDAGQIAETIREHFPFSHQPKNNDLIGLSRLPFSEPALYYIHSGKTRQSNIYFYRDGIKYADDRERLTASCFNKYFGQDMFSIVFQEIREFRSLGYSASASYLFYYKNIADGFLYGMLGTQSDKTIEGITAMKTLMDTLPQKTEKFEVAKEALIQSQRSAYISFRDIPGQVRYWVDEGRTYDPRTEQIRILESLTLEDVSGFYNRAGSNNPLLVSFVGDTRKIDKKELSFFGNRKKVTFKDVFRK